jgi:hypothetical protein
MQGPQVQSSLSILLCLTLNPGMSFVATSRATAIGDCGTGEVIPRKCTNSAIYFKAGTFPTGLKCLTHSYKGVEYKRVQEHTSWVSYLDRQQEQTSTVDDESEKMEIQQWMENKKYTRDQPLSVVRSQSWRQNTSFKLPKNNNFLYTKTEEYSAISHPKLSHILITSRNKYEGIPNRRLFGIGYRGKRHSVLHTNTHSTIIM